MISTLILIFIFISAAGTINAGYMAHKHKKEELWVCPLNQDCTAVTNSKWSSVFGIRNELLGLAFYAFALMLGLAMLASPYIFDKLLLYALAFTAAGFFYSAFLFFVQIFAIKSYCFYCLISGFLSLLLFSTSILFIFAKGFGA